MSEAVFWGLLFIGHSNEVSDKFLQTNIQAVVDHSRQFISFDLGWPGPVTDIKMFKHSYLWTHRRLHFKNGEYILVDKGDIVFMTC